MKETMTEAAALESAAELAEEDFRYSDAAALWRRLATLTPNLVQRRACLQAAEEADERAAELEEEAHAEAMCEGLMNLE